MISKLCCENMKITDFWKFYDENDKNWLLRNSLNILIDGYHDVIRLLSLNLSKISYANMFILCLEAILNCIK